MPDDWRTYSEVNPDTGMVEEWQTDDGGNFTFVREVSAPQEQQSTGESTGQGEEQFDVSQYASNLVSTLPPEWQTAYQNVNTRKTATYPERRGDGSIWEITYDPETDQVLGESMREPATPNISMQGQNQSSFQGALSQMTPSIEYNQGDVAPEYGGYGDSREAGSVLREYPEQRPDGSVWTVRQMADGTFQEENVQKAPFMSAFGDFLGSFNKQPMVPPEWTNPQFNTPLGSQGLSDILQTPGLDYGVPMVGMIDDLARVGRSAGNDAFRLMSGGGETVISSGARPATAADVSDLIQRLPESGPVRINLVDDEGREIYNATFNSPYVAAERLQGFYDSALANLPGPQVKLASNNRVLVSNKPSPDSRFVLRNGSFVDDPSNTLLHEEMANIAGSSIDEVLSSGAMRVTSSRDGAEAYVQMDQMAGKPTPEQVQSLSRLFDTAKTVSISVTNGNVGEVFGISTPMKDIALRRLQQYFASY